MTTSWRLRELFSKTRDGEPRRDHAKEGGSLTGMIEFGDFKIDLHGQTITLRGQELRLTAEELDVLTFLANHPRRLVTPRTVLTTSRDTKRFRQAEFLRALISLRKKLEAAWPGKHYLRTEPWVIYRFDPSSSSAA